MLKGVVIGRRWFAALAIIAGPMGHSLAADLAYGEYLAGECAACHSAGADAGIPAIHAMPAADFIEALKQYRDGERDHDLMRTVVRSLGEAEMEALAAYFQQRKN